MPRKKITKTVFAERGIEVTTPRMGGFIEARRRIEQTDRVIRQLETEAKIYQTILRAEDYFSRLGNPLVHQKLLKAYTIMRCANEGKISRKEAIKKLLPLVEELDQLIGG